MHQRNGKQKNQYHQRAHASTREGRVGFPQQGLPLAVGE